MFQRISVLLILLTAFALLATPAMAKDPVTKLVVRNNLKTGRQFEAVFQPGLYVLHPDTPGFYWADLKLHVISNPAPACFVRDDHNHPEFLGHLDPLMLRPSDVWRYFEVQDTCYLRFEIRDYRQGAVNIRKVRKIKTVELTEEWQDVTFTKGHWSGSGRYKYFLGQYKFDPNNSACKVRSNNGPGFSYKPSGNVSAQMGFILEETCVVKMRGRDDVWNDDGSYTAVPAAMPAIFVKSR